MTWRWIHIPNNWRYLFLVACIRVQSSMTEKYFALFIFLTINSWSKQVYQLILNLMIKMMSMSFFITSMLLNNCVKFIQHLYRPKKFPLLSSYSLLLLPWKARLCLARNLIMQTILNKFFLQCSFLFSSCPWASLSIVWCFCNLVVQSSYQVVIFKTWSTLVSCSLSVLPRCIQSSHPSFANWPFLCSFVNNLQPKQNSLLRSLE